MNVTEQRPEPSEPPPLTSVTITLTATEAYNLEAFLHFAAINSTTRISGDTRGMAVAETLYFKLPTNR